MTTQQEAVNLVREKIEEYLINSGYSKFGCACDPSVGYLCSYCSAHKRQQLLREALAALDVVKEPVAEVVSSHTAALYDELPIGKTLHRTTN